ncbi:MAG TPA: DNA ligase D [Xanthobacteraceae bacterium]|nr:DNA ligase D [Xanthobacteraceae bacterium]
MGLQIYRRKRKFNVTPEPRGQVRRTEGHQFVIQKHAARRLHYDLRLELGGVMKSWAVTRGPSLVPGEKRLAVHVEDHPIEYNAFEGTIPAGEYGGGTVMIWDRGRWHPEGDPYAGYKKGHLDFSLEGEKLHGRWHLVRMHGRAGEKKEPWLLIKSKDEAARSASDQDILEEQPLSVVSGRSIPEIAEGKGRKRVWHSNRSVKENVKAGATKRHAFPALGSAQKSSQQRARTRRDRAGATKSSRGSAGKNKDKDRRPRDAPLPAFVLPSLATLHSTVPSGRGWAHEIKFDGYRIQARLDRHKARLLTRKGLDWTEKFPNVAAAVAKLPAGTALIDGEIVVEDENGISNFSELQAALKQGERERFIYYVFDLLHLDGCDLTGLPMVERKAELLRLLAAAETGPVIYSEHFGGDGQAVLRAACQFRLEGIVSKRLDAPYRSGRSESFIKIKCSNAQELVVGGYSPSTALPRAIGALVVGYYDDGQLVYAGRVGTGYTQTLARDLWKQLHPLETSAPPFDQIPRVEARRSDVRWVEPRTVIEAQLRGWTADGLVRQAAFKGVREDKSPREVVREKPAPAEAEEGAAAAPKSAAETAKSMTRASKTKPRARAHKPPSGRQASPSEIRFTNPDRVYWADVGVTKQDLADYYRSVWDWMAPHIVSRPLALVRCPEGTSGQCFFQKHASAGLTEKNLRTVIDSNRRQVIAVEDLDGVLSLVQAGVLELHVRGSTIDRLDICNRIVFDIDPGEGVTWAGVVAAARDVRERLAALDLESFVKLSGGKGLHVVLPIGGADWRTTKNFAQAVALAITADAPARYVAKITKSLRRGKIFIDYLRNSLEQTSVAAYSTRARPGAAASAPVTWEELGRTKSGNQYTMLNLGKRLSGLKQDPWKDIGRVKQNLPDVRTLRRR